MNSRLNFLGLLFGRLISTGFTPKRQKFSLRYPFYSLDISLGRFLNKMSTIQELERERKSLEDRVHDLVDKLESRKQSNEIKVPKDAVIKSKEERDAINAIEQIDLNKNPSKQADTANEAKKSDQLTKKQEQRLGKQKGDAGSKEPEKPIDISRLDLRIGKILEVSHHPDADALYLEKIDCGDATGPRTVISGLVKHVPIDEMRERMVVVLCNLKPAKMRGIVSEAMVMCASTPEKVELIQPPEGVKPGDRVLFDKYPGEPDSQLNPKKKIWEQVAPDIKTDDQGVATYKDCMFKVGGVDGQFKSSLKNVQIR